MTAPTEYLIVVAEIVGNPDLGFEHVYYKYDRYPTLAAARRAGLKEFGHDDFNIAYVQGDVLVRWTWMGEDTEPPTIGEELTSQAKAIGLTVDS